MDNANSTIKVSDCKRGKCIDFEDKISLYDKILDKIYGYVPSAGTTITLAIQYLNTKAEANKTALELQKDFERVRTKPFLGFK